LGATEELHIHIGGNFDRPLSGIIHDILLHNQTNDKHIIVLECSSFMLWQLRDFVFDVSNSFRSDIIDENWTCIATVITFEN
jgi:UDP-N-acetylmuramoylalanine-D-glutamate ligase